MQADDLKIFDEKEIESPTVTTGALNGGLPLEVMQQIPCSIGFSYVRVETNGDVKACCVSPFTIGEIRTKNFEDVWNSSEYNTWRAKFLNIHKRKFHLHDAEFSFCQICPHIPQNIEFSNFLLKPESDKK